MQIVKKLPVGLDDFEKIRQEDFYYIDKSCFIKELLCNWGEVNLFTRPRRFGKTLNMDMLKRFLEIDNNPSLFEGLEIAKGKELCERYMGKFPVIFLSLKSVEGRNFKTALANMSTVIQEEARHFQFLLDSDRLTEIDKAPLRKLYEDEITAERQRSSLKLLSEMLHKHFGRKVVILIDEYDVPLDKAYENGYYDEMSDHIRSVFEMALKSNKNLYFAVVTGCLRISKESIFTGLNNFSVHTISDSLYDEYFGFTDREVKRLLDDYGMSDKYDEVKEWYDGYRFGQEHVYCPWDVLSYVKDHLSEHDGEVKSYWINSSSNTIVKQLIEQATETVKDQIENLISGEAIEQRLVNELTYKDLSVKDENQRMLYLWSVLYTTGYLTDSAPGIKGIHRLVIPNKEVQEIFERQIQTWFSERVKRDSEKLEKFWNIVKSGKPEEMQEQLNDYLRSTISIRDTFVQKEKKENFYHGILLGLLGGNGDWVVKSNAASGDGYSDILVEIPSEKIGCVIEVKYAEQGKMDEMCAEAMKQIVDKNYTEQLRLDGMQVIHAYGVACYKKESRVIYQKGSIKNGI